MHGFSSEKLSEMSWDNGIVTSVVRIHEYKGKQELYSRLKSVELGRLMEIAKVQSTDASNRIEGIVTTNARLRQLVEDKTTPRCRAESEILGYRNVLQMILENYSVIPVRPNFILQMHKELLKYTTLSYAGRFKAVPNEIDAILPDGRKRVLFQPLEPYETPEAVSSLCESYQKALAQEVVDPLILIPCFVLDFLCIHPFTDGNGRMSRLLTLLLLYQSGYMVGKYISIEKAIEETKETYYEALSSSDQGWKDGRNDPRPFIRYFLGILVSCCRDFEERLSLVEKNTSHDAVQTYAEKKLGMFTKQEVLESCPRYGSSSVESALKQLVGEGILKRLGQGKNTKYCLKDTLIK